MSKHWAGCTDLSASWCPNCGTCTCEDREVSMSDKGCPLHDPNSCHHLPSPDEVVTSLMQHPVLAQQVYKKLQRLFTPVGETSPPPSDHLLDIWSSI